MKNDAIKNAGLKITKNRQLVLEALKRSEKPLTAEDIYLSLRRKEVNLSTVYRILNIFVEAGLAKRDVNEKKENIFSLRKEDEEDSHVLVCSKCHKRLPLKGCPYHEVNEKIEKETGFAVQDQNIEIYGICPDCQNEKPS